MLIGEGKLGYRWVVDGNDWNASTSRCTWYALARLAYTQKCDYQKTPIPLIYSTLCSRQLRAVDGVVGDEVVM
jgi:hypothetical protein